MRRPALVIALVLIDLSRPVPVLAAVERYALIAGNNAGARDEVTLHHAEDDAAKLADVLSEIGSVPPENLLLLKGRDAATVRKALIALNERIRMRTQDPTVQPLLLVYFSGHGDARALHLGGTELELAELEALVRGSAASYRVLLLDACRSGALTQVKGGTAAPPFPIVLEARLDVEGIAFLTSSSANEEAQESEELGGSFFTHYLVSGLLGAADLDGDGKVGLREAYAYAYEHTLRASSRTLVGTQHPTFSYQERGKSDLILTELVESDGRRAVLELPSERSYLVMAGSSEGAVVAEVAGEDRVRRLSVKPGRYFLRSRGRDYLLEGSVSLSGGERLTVDESALERIAYARLVRKGKGPLDWVHGPSAGYTIRSPLFAGATPCQGAFAGYGFDLSAFSVISRLGACHAGFQNAFLAATADEANLELRLVAPFDFRWVSLTLGLGAGGALLRESFQTTGLAPDRLTTAGELLASAGAELDLDAGLYLSADLEALAYFYRQSTNGESPAIRPSLAARMAVGVGKRW